MLKLLLTYVSEDIVFHYFWMQLKATKKSILNYEKINVAQCFGAILS